MIGEGRLDIKLAVPSMELLGQGQAIYHEKIGVFLDREENAVAFTWLTERNGWRIGQQLRIARGICVVG